MESSTFSQNRKILHYLETHKNGITSMDAFTKFGVTRLSARIHNLRKKGYPIVTEMCTKNNADGHAVNYARYKLHDES